MLGVVEPGTILAGKYQVDRVLGAGGMGQVVRAIHLQLGQPVAMKFLLPEVLHDATIVQRFLREAQAAVRLRSEHVARVIDVGTLDTGAPYMVLEYLEGCDLSQFPRDQLSAGLVVDLVLQACEALAEAHAVGIVHRDIKPANLFVTQRPDGSPLVKILDFGISKASHTDAKLTSTRAVMGTPAYMSPEQMQSTRDVDARSDLWSLGAVMYELLEGAAPFEADTLPLLYMKVMTAPLRPFTRPVAPQLAAIVYRLLEKDPAQRFSTVGEVVRAIAPFAASQTQAAISIERTGGGRITGPVRLATGPVPLVTPPSTISGASGAMLTAAPPRKRWPIVAGIVLAGCLGAAIVLAVGRSGGQQPAPHAAAAPAPAKPAVTPPPTAAVTPPPTTAATPPPTVTVTPPPTAAVTPPPTEPSTASGSAAAGSDAVAAHGSAAPHVVRTHATPHPKHPPRPPASSGKPPATDDDILGARH
jgi:serine/threonine-protein kinase